MNWGLIVRESLFVGALMSGALTVLIVLSLMINKEMWLQDYPPDVKEKWGPMSQTAKVQRIFLAIPLLGVMVAAVVYDVVRLQEVLGAEPSFLAVFTSIVIIFVIFNLVDAVIIDYLILVVLWPGLAVLPGTEGMAGYKDVRLWTINLLKGFVLAPVFGLLAGGGATLFFLWLRNQCRSFASLGSQIARRTKIENLCQ